MDVPELRRWIEDALSRHERDMIERAEQPVEVSTAEIVDAVWGRLPLQVRRQVSRAQVQASLTMLSLRYGLSGVRLRSSAGDRGDPAGVGSPPSAGALEPPAPDVGNASQARPATGGAHRS